MPSKKEVLDSLTAEDIELLLRRYVSNQLGYLVDIPGSNKYSIQAMYIHNAFNDKGTWHLSGINTEKEYKLKGEILARTQEGISFLVGHQIGNTLRMIEGKTDVSEPDPSPL